MNQPYVKHINPATGEVLNPINGHYPSKVFLGYSLNKFGEKDLSKPMFYPNRAERRRKRVPSSVKISKRSSLEGSVFRTNKYAKYFSSFYQLLMKLYNLANNTSSIQDKKKAIKVINKRIKK